MYQWQEDTENLERYRVGGYHPVRIDYEYSAGRYRIVTSSAGGHTPRFGLHATYNSIVT